MSKITVTEIAGQTSGSDQNLVKLPSNNTLQVDNIVNRGGDNDSGVDLSSNDVVAFKTANTERVRIDDSGNVLIGETSQINGGFLNLATSGASNALSFLCRSTDNGHQNQIIMQKSSTNSGNFAATADNESLGSILFRGVNTSNVSDIAAYIEVVQDGTSSSTVPAEMRFGTTETERMRIDSSGRFLFGSTTYDSNNVSVLINSATGLLFATASGDAPVKINRKSSDGELVELLQDSNKEGSLSVSGSTVTLVGFSGQHESSGIATNTAVGTVVSTIDELDTYASGDKEGQTRADHPKVKVSDTEGDKAVYGVVDRFNANNKVIVSAVGIGSVRVTGACAKGDLLESNGDGTAKVQSDDIIRSKTLGKVTIGNSDTKEKLVSCVLYCG